MGAYNEGETYPGTVELIAPLRTYKGELTIFGDVGANAAWEKIIHVEVSGSAAVVAATLSWAADAFKEDQER